MSDIDGVVKFGKKAKGRAERIKVLQGKKVTRGEAIWANCYDCMGGYCDVVRDCERESCSLYQFHPYKGVKRG